MEIGGSRAPLGFMQESPGLTLCEFCSSTCGLTQNRGASNAHNNSLGMTEDCRNLNASWAFDIHEVGIGMLNKSLELVLALLLRRQRVQKILGELRRKTLRLECIFSTL